MYGRVKLQDAQRIAVGVAAVALTTTKNAHGIVIKALCPGQTIYIGSSAANATVADGYPLSDKETLTLEVKNGSAVYAIADAAAQAVAVLPFYRVN